jgi:two-component system, NarL family, nitrate/nitrite response regulator NarL
MQFSVSILGSNPIACLGLSRIIESEGARVMSSSFRVEELVSNDAALSDLIVIDLPSREEQWEALDKLIQRKTVVLVETFNYRAMVGCFSRGAHGYLVKDISCEALMASLHLASLGQKIFPPNLADAIPQDLLSASVGADYKSALDDTNLTEREHCVLNLLVEGHSNKAIARKLEAAESTIKVHVKAIFRKLEVGNRTQAALWGKSRGFGTHAMESAS